MGHKYTKEEILAGGLEAALDEGLSQLTFGRLAKRLGTSDRVVVYYFPTKDVLISEVVAVMGVELQRLLAQAFTEPADNHLALARQAWPLLATPEIDPSFALFFEATGLAAAGREPYRTLVPQLVRGWTEWLATFVEGTPEHRRIESEAAIALIDGLLLMRTLLGPGAAQGAARRLGVTDHKP